MGDGVAIAEFVGGSRDPGSDIKGAMGRNKLGGIEIVKFQPACGLVAVGTFRRAAFVGKMLLKIVVSPLVVARRLQFADFLEVREGVFLFIHRRVVGPDRLLVEEDAFLGKSPERHGPQATIADRVGVLPEGGSRIVPDHAILRRGIAHTVRLWRCLVAVFLQLGCNNFRDLCGSIRIGVNAIRKKLRALAERRMQVNDWGLGLGCKAFKEGEDFLFEDRGIDPLVRTLKSRHGLDHPDHGFARQRPELGYHLLVGDAKFPAL